MRFLPEDKISNRPYLPCFYSFCLKSDYIPMGQRVYLCFKQHIVVHFNTVLPDYVLDGQWLAVKQNRVPFVTVNKKLEHQMPCIYSTEISLYFAIIPEH